MFLSVSVDLVLTFPRQPAEYVDLADNYSPIIYRVNKALGFRAVHPNEPFVQVDNDFVTRFDHPPPELVHQARSQIESLIKAADVKKVPPKAKGRASRNAMNKPLSGLDVDALLGASGAAKGGKPVRISKENAIPEFKQALASAVDIKQIGDLAAQMGEIVRSLISSSTGDIHYARAAENMRVMREELISLEEPALYNQFTTDLKAQLANEELGGPRLEMWWTIRTSGLGLITKGESDESNVTDEAAREVRMASHLTAELTSCITNLLVLIVCAAIQAKEGIGDFVKTCHFLYYTVTVFIRKGGESTESIGKSRCFTGLIAVFRH